MLNGFVRHILSKGMFSACLSSFSDFNKFKFGSFSLYGATEEVVGIEERISLVDFLLVKTIDFVME